MQLNPLLEASIREFKGHVEHIRMANASVNWSSDDEFVGPISEGSSPFLKVYHWYFFAFNVVFMGPTIIGNSLILISLIRFRRLRLIRAYILVGNLALSDLLVGLVAMPMDIAFLVTDKFTNSIPFCTAHMSSIYTFIGLSVVNLFLLSMERFDAIVSPFEHDRRFTKSRIYVCIAFTWIFMILFGFLPFVTMKNIDREHFQCRMKQVFPLVYRKLFLSIVLLSLVLSTVFFLYIVRVATRNIAGFNRTDSLLQHRRMKKDLRHTRSMLIITGLFIAFWGPFCVVSLVPDPSNTVLLVRNWLSSLGVINSCINWMVYGVRCKKFRAAFISILKCSCVQKDYKLPATSF